MSRVQLPSVTPFFGHGASHSIHFMQQRPLPLDAAKKLLVERYPDFECAFAAGSLMRGEGTAFSDIDFVVIYAKVEHARRESLVYHGWPIEVFIHDPETLQYFFEEFDRKSGIPSLPNMVSEGVLIPDSHPNGEKYRALANDILKKGPPALSEDSIKNSRYMITDALDDLRAPRNRNEIVGTGVKLYEELANFYLRSKNLWASHPKYLVKTLAKHDPQLAREYESAFEKLFKNNDSTELFALAEKILAPTGGALFAGFSRNAPKEWRLSSEPTNR
jgi:hypothetical protein